VGEAVETGETDGVAGDGACGAVSAVFDGSSLLRYTIASSYASRALLSRVHLASLLVADACSGRTRVQCP